MQRLEEKRNVKRAVWFTLGTLVIVAGLATLGFNLLAKLFVFWSSVRSNNGSASEKTDFIPPSPPQIVVPFESTNSATFSIKGISEPGATVYLSQNDSEVKSLKVPDEGIFEFENLVLNEGNNTFTSVAVDDAGNRSQVSGKVAVNFSTKVPLLELSSPNDRQTFTGRDVKISVKGKTDPGNHVVVNDRVVIVGSDGSFSLQLGLNSGENPLIVVATNLAGNQTKKELIVIFNPS
jgi:cytoskeletal protein RodZ